MNSPSARFRVRQYIGALAGYGVAMTERFPAAGAYPPPRRMHRPLWMARSVAERVSDIVASWQDDLVLLQREMVSTLPTLEGLTRRPRLVDIDDAVHLFRGGWAARHLARLADLVVVGNAWLAEVWRPWAPVEILPTAVDTARYLVAPLPECPVLGWIGTAGNLSYLQTIVPALEAVLRRFPQTTIAICCDRPVVLGALPIRFVPWSDAAEAPFLASLTIGLMPLADGEWERGKCSFKMLQYMAAGRPCVVSPVGMNREILGEGEVGLAAATAAEWEDALCALITGRAAAARMGMAGRAVAEAKYSVDALAPRLAELLRRLA